MIHHRPKSVKLGTTGQIQEHMKNFRSNGLTVNHDKEAGTIDVLDGDEIVFRALQMGRHGGWICSFYDTARVTWKPPPED